MSPKILCHGASHVGQVRTDNEDQFLVADLSKSMHVAQTSLGLDHHAQLIGESQGKLLMVADGMGGHASGERASALAVDEIAKYLLNTAPCFFRLDGESEKAFRADLEAALQQSQDAITAEAIAIPQRQGMGTTVTLAYILWPRMYVVQVGDSRCYLHEQGKLRRLTRDHTMSELYAEQDESDATETQPAAFSHMLWNVVGGSSDDLTIDVSRTDLKVGDSVLLCSDGLTRHVDDDRLAERLASDDEPVDICQKLIAEANADGGMDNITVVVARFLADENDDNAKSAVAPQEHSVGSLPETIPHIPTPS